MKKYRYIFIVTAILFSGLFIPNVHAATSWAVGQIDASSVLNNYLGGYAKWATPKTYTTTDSGFTAQVLWVGTQNNSYRWVEVGLTKGWGGNNSTWTMYWAESKPAYAEYKVSGVLPGKAGSNHTYQVQYDSFNTWGAYIDYKKVGTSSQSAGTIWIDTGAEVTSSDNTLTATYPSYMQCLKAGVWKYWNNCSGTIASFQNSTSFIWKWLDAGTYKFGKDYK